MSTFITASACLLAIIGAEVNLIPDRDATLIQPIEEELASGSGDGIYAGRVGENGGGTVRRAVLRFALDGIPAGSTVTGATLTLTSVIGMGGPQSMNLHRVLADWGEGASVSGGGFGAPPEKGDATWGRRFWPATIWGNFGGDFAAVSSASANAAAVGPCVFASNAELIAEVQAWLDDPSSNFGWIVIGNESTLQSVRRFGSRETPDESARPSLVISYDAPALPGDINGDQLVDGADLAIVLGSWGPCKGCAADVTGDGVVDGADIAVILGHWS